MQFKNIAFSLFVAAATADTLTDLVTSIPSCALTCLVTSASNIGCGVTDYSCQCNKASELQSDALSCVTAACSTADQATTLTVSAEICASLGIDTVSSAVASATAAAGSAVSSISSSLASAASTATATTTSASSTATPSKAAAGRVELGAMAGVAALFAYAL